MKGTIPQIKTSLGLPFVPSAFTLLALTLVCSGLVHVAQAVNPPPDGGYAGGNTAEGQNALFSLTTGTYNTAVGLFSLRNNTEGQFNTAIGAGALLSNNPGSHNAADGIVNSSQNTATGAGALLSNTTGAHNTADGAFALFTNTTGVENTATGSNALFDNTTGTGNTADGAFALPSNTIGFQNTANGTFALFSNTEGSFNTASGNGALYSNTNGDTNTAIGASALQNNTTGSGNTAIGDAALFENTTGMFNTAIGRSALSANTTGTANIAIGVAAGNHTMTGGGNIYIGNNPGADESDTIRIGDVQTRTFIGGIHDTTVTGLAVVVSASGQLGVAPSSARFKDEIKPMESASEAILALKPVTFRYRKDIDPAHTKQFGLVAEEVEKVNPDLVVRDKERKPYGVRYDQVNAMLLNEFLKEHRKVQKLEKGMAVLAAQLKEQAAQIQNVSAKVEVNKSTTKVVLDNL